MEVPDVLYTVYCILYIRERPTCTWFDRPGQNRASGLPHRGMAHPIEADRGVGCTGPGGHRVRDGT